MRTPRPIGILGGMGPEATVLMMQRIISCTPAARDQDHIQLLVDSNPQVPSRIDHLIRRTGPDPAPVLAGMAQQLEAMGARALVMPCNTAHFYAPAITAACGIPLISMIEAVPEAIKASGLPLRRAGILASPAVRMTGIYEAPARARGLEPLYCSEEDELLQLIQTIKAEGVTDLSRRRLGALAAGLRAAGADCIVTACTEFSLLFDGLEADVPAFDALNEVSRAVVAFAMQDVRQGQAYGGG